MVKISKFDQNVKLGHDNDLPPEFETIRWKTNKLFSLWLQPCWKTLPAKIWQCNKCKKVGDFEKLCWMKVTKEGGHVPRSVVGQIRLAKASTVKDLVKNKNRTLGKSEALLDYGADISLGELNFFEEDGFVEIRFEEAIGENYLGCKSK